MSLYPSSNSINLSNLPNLVIGKIISSLTPSPSLTPPIPTSSSLTQDGNDIISLCSSCKRLHRFGTMYPGYWKGLTIETYYFMSSEEIEVLMERHFQPLHLQPLHLQSRFYNYISYSNFFNKLSPINQLRYHISVNHLAQFNSPLYTADQRYIAAALMKREDLISYDGIPRWDMNYFYLIEDYLLGKEVDITTNRHLAIRIASEYGHVEVVKILLQEDEVDPTINNNSPLRGACWNNQLEIVKLLLNWKKLDQDDDLIYVDPTDLNNSALRWSSWSGNVEIVTELLEWEGPNGEKVDPSTKNNEAIRMARQQGYEGVMDLLKRYVE